MVSEESASYDLDREEEDANDLNCNDVSTTDSDDDVEERLRQEHLDDQLSTSSEETQM
jgi:hypothetical protein